MNRKEFIKLASGAAVLATAGCTTTASKDAAKPAPKKVDAVTSATPVIKWKPFPDVKKVRVVQWGMRHEHADGKFKSVRKLPNDYELVGIVEDLSSKTLAEKRGFKLYDGVPRLTPEQVWDMAAKKEIQCVFVEVTNDDLPGIAWKCAKHGLAMHMDKPAGQKFAQYEALVTYIKSVTSQSEVPTDLTADQKTWMWKSFILGADPLFVAEPEVEITSLTANATAGQWHFTVQVTDGTETSPAAHEVAEAKVAALVKVSSSLSPASWSAPGSVVTGTTNNVVTVTVDFGEGTSGFMKVSE